MTPGHWRLGVADFLPRRQWPPRGANDSPFLNDSKRTNDAPIDSFCWVAGLELPGLTLAIAIEYVATATINITSELMLLGHIKLILSFSSSPAPDFSARVGPHEYQMGGVWGVY